HWLVAQGLWGESQEQGLVAEVDREIATAFDDAVAYRDSGDVDPLEMFDFVFSKTPANLLEERDEAAAAFHGKRVVVGAGKERTKPGGAAAVGELEEAEDVPKGGRS